MKARRQVFWEELDAEKLDPEPHSMAVTDPVTRPPDLKEELMRFAQQLWADKHQERESPEEADDFEEDDPDAEIITPYEAVLMEPDMPREPLGGPRKASEPPPEGKVEEGPAEAAEAPSEEKDT